MSHHRAIYNCTACGHPTVVEQDVKRPTLENYHITIGFVCENCGIENSGMVTPPEIYFQQD